MPLVTGAAHDFSSVSLTNQFELLREMGPQAALRFTKMARTTVRQRGEWIFVLGDPPDFVYFLRKGRMKITAATEDGHEVLHEIIGPGQIFGDTSAMLGIPRTTSAQAVEKSQLFEMCRADFESLLMMYPEISLRLLKSVSLRLKTAEAQLVNVICNDVSGRVREALIHLMMLEPSGIPGRPVRIRITQQDLANLVGASRQKTWQALKQLEDSGVLRLTYGSILITAAHKLRNQHVGETYATATGSD